MSPLLYRRCDRRLWDERFNVAAAAAGRGICSVCLLVGIEEPCWSHLDTFGSRRRWSGLATASTMLEQRCCVQLADTPSHVCSSEMEVEKTLKLLTIINKPQQRVDTQVPPLLG